MRGTKPRKGGDEVRQGIKKLWGVLSRGDNVLLLLCLVTSCLGCIAIASATAHRETLRYVFIQMGAIAIGVVMYVIVSCIDLEFISEHRRVLVVFNVVLLLLLIPFAT